MEKEKLKTLKDIERCNGTTINKSEYFDYVKTKELKDEAVKWYKNMHLYDEHNFMKACFIRQFFNLTEEDLQ